MILGLRTDSDQAEVILAQPNGKILAQRRWPAGRQLSGELLGTIKQLLLKVDKGWPAVTGLVVFEGPGSFTGLRIGITVANALSYGLNLAIIGTTGENWLRVGIQQLEAAPSRQLIRPQYGRLPNITIPKG